MSGAHRIICLAWLGYLQMLQHEVHHWTKLVGEDKVAAVVSITSASTLQDVHSQLESPVEDKIDLQLTICSPPGLDQTETQQLTSLAVSSYAHLG